MVVVMVGGEGVDEGAVVVVEIEDSPGGEEGGDGGSPGALMDEMIAVYTNKKVLLSVLNTSCAHQC